MARNAESENVMLAPVAMLELDLVSIFSLVSFHAFSLDRFGNLNLWHKLCHLKASGKKSLVRSPVQVARERWEGSRMRRESSQCEICKYLTVRRKSCCDGDVSLLTHLFAYPVTITDYFWINMQITGWDYIHQLRIGLFFLVSFFIWTKY